MIQHNKDNFPKSVREISRFWFLLNMNCDISSGILLFQLFDVDIYIAAVNM